MFMCYITNYSLRLLLTLVSVWVLQKIFFGLTDYI